MINLNNFSKVLTAEDVMDETPKIDAGKVAHPNDFVFLQMVNVKIIVVNKS